MNSASARTQWWRRPAVWLVVVAVAHALSPLVLMGLHWWFGIDETVYLSQINGHVPAGVFSAPRARGATFIAAPVTLLTANVAAVRIWVTALSGIGLYLAFRPWLRLRPGMIVPVAAFVFSSLWMVIYYGFEVMPNEWVAFATLAATGYLLRYLGEGRRRHLVPIVLSMIAIGLLRPSDALFCGGALALACFIVRAPGRLRSIAIVAVAAGATLGSAEWVIEAYTSFGGLLKRVHNAQAEQGGGGLHFAGAAQFRALAGPILCRWGCKAHADFVYQLWWFAAAALLVVALIHARRIRDLGPTAVPMVVGGAMAAQYVFTVGYAAPRFLTPAYALLSLPVASALVVFANHARSKPPRVALRVVLVAALVVNLAIQVQVITVKIRPGVQAYARHVLGLAAQLRAAGVRKPCTLLGGGGYNQPTSYAMGCSNTNLGVAGIRAEVADGDTVIVLSTARPASAYHVAWRRVPLQNSAAALGYAFISTHTTLGAPGGTIR